MSAEELAAARVWSCMRKLITLGILLLFVVGGAARGDATLHLEDVSADGVELRKVDCKVDGAVGLLGGLAVVAAIAKQKSAIDACAPDGAAFAIALVWRDGRTASARVTDGGSAREQACIARALKRVPAPMVASCTAVLLAGDKAAATKAADHLASR